MVDCLEAALWVFYSTDNFRDAVLAAANLGDDADTTAAVCGQIAGACYGTEAMPKDWLQKLASQSSFPLRTGLLPSPILWAVSLGAHFRRVRTPLAPPPLWQSAIPTIRLMIKKYVLDG